MIHSGNAIADEDRTVEVSGWEPKPEVFFVERPKATGRITTETRDIDADAVGGRYHFVRADSANSAYRANPIPTSGISGMRPGGKSPVTVEGQCKTWRHSRQD